MSTCTDVKQEPLVHYTEEEILSLKDHLAKGSSIFLLLKLTGGDPYKFCEMLRVLSKEWAFVYATPLESLPLTMCDPRYEGWRAWRFSIGK